MLEAPTYEVPDPEMLKRRAEGLLDNHNAHAEPYSVEYEHITLSILPDVFSPAYGPSTWLMAKTITVHEKDTVLDMGTGSGALAVLAAQNAAHVVAVDISPYAVECARLNAKQLGLEAKVDVRQSDLFETIHPDEKFSLILFNPPFIDEKPTTWLERTLYDEGNQVVARFLQQASDYLTPNGRIIMIFGTAGDVRHLHTLLAASPFDARIIYREKIMIDFFIYELIKPSAEVCDTALWGEEDHPQVDIGLFLVRRGKPWAEASTAVEISEDESSQWSDVQKAPQCMETLRTRLNQLHFIPVVTQLSHFGISDPVKEGFIAAIYSNPDFYQIYFDTIKSNLTPQGKYKGPIGPSPGLYKRPFWYSSIKCASSPQSMLPSEAAVKFVGYRLDIEHRAETQSQVAGYIQGFHERVAQNYKKKKVLDTEYISDFIIIPFLRMHHDSVEANPDFRLQGGVFFALGHFEDNIKQEGLPEINKLLAVLSRDLDQEVKKEIARRYALVDAERRVHEDWKKFMGSVSHGFQREPATYGIIVDKVLEATSGIDQHLIQRLRWIKDSSERRGAFYDFLLQLSRYLNGETSRVLGEPIALAATKQLNNWIEKIWQDLRLSFILKGKKGKWSDATFVPQIGPLISACTIPHKAAGDYIFSELLLNALRSCSGKQRIHVELESDNNSQQWMVWNDIDLVPISVDLCATCSSEQKGQLWRTRSDDNAPRTGECCICLDSRIRASIRPACKSGYTTTPESKMAEKSGSGLGLFLVHFLIEQVYHGTITLSVTDQNYSDLLPGAWTENHGICVRVHIPHFKV